MNIIFFTLKAFSYENGNILIYDEQLLVNNSKFINNCLFNETSDQVDKKRKHE